MPGQNTQQLFDITPLQPLVEAGYVLLTPNYRLARRVKSAWDNRQTAQGRRLWDPLQVFPLESWLLQRWREAVRLGHTADLVPLAPGPALELWQQAIEQEQADGGRYSLLQPAAAASLASDARENLLRWQLDPEAGAVRRSFQLDDDCAAFLAWLDRFQRRLETGGLATPADSISALLACAAAMPRSRVALLVFDDIPPLYRACLQALSEEVAEIEPRGPMAECVTTSYADQRTELAAVARWARQCAEERPGASVAIVLADMAAQRVPLEYLLRREFDCLGEAYNSLPVNFSTGITLDRAPVVRDAMRILRLGLDSVAIAEVVPLLQSRFALLPDAQSALAAEFLTRLFDTGREVLEVADLRYLASQVKLEDEQGLALGRHLMAMAGLRELRRPALPSSWVQRCCDILDIWAWPGPGPLDSLEYQQVELWYRTLEEFAGYDEISEAVSLEGALQLLQRCLARQVSQPQTEDSQVQVLGPLEAAGLNFDALWLCGMQGSRWPAPARPSPFIPMVIQRELQMPHATAQREWDVARGLLDQYQRCAAVLHASFARQIDGVPELPSPLLEAFVTRDSDDEAGVDPAWQDAWEGRALELLDDRLAPAVESPELESLGGGALLEDQSQCPFRAFARRRLGAQSLGEATAGLSPARRGSILHNALYALFGNIPDSTALQKLDTTGQQALVEQAVEAALLVLPQSGTRAVSRAWRELESQRLESLLHEWLALEKQRSEFAVAALEADVSLNLESLQINLRVDRIDRLPDGSALIIDYKSGKCRLQDWLGERPANPQLLLYGIASQQAPAAISFAQVRRDDCVFVGAGDQAAAPGIRTDIGKLPRGGWEVADWDALNARWRAQLQGLAREFVAGVAVVDPLPGACTWCDLHALCRVGQEEHP